jgi:hypothetical protein
MIPDWIAGMALGALLIYGGIGAWVVFNHFWKDDDDDGQ